MKWIKRITLCVCVLVVLICGVVIGRNLLHPYQEEKAYREMSKDVHKESESTSEDAAATGEENIKIDFQLLWEANEDIYAWMEIPGTNIAYPVLQHDSDDSYYLNHTIDHEEGLPGSIYSERISNKDFSDFIHIIYGHNMKAGTMFAQLHKFKDATFFEANDSILIYTPEHTYTYEIFAAVVNDDRHIMYSYDFSTEEGRMEFLDDILNNADNRNQYRKGAAITAEDKILVLSTCVGGESDKRYLVVGVLTDTK